MTDEDDFLTEARRNWRAQDSEVEAVSERLKLSTRFGRWMALNDLAGVVLGVVAGAVIIWMGVTRGEAAMLLAGAVLMLVLPPLCWQAWRARVEEPKWDVETSEGVLRQMLARTEVGLRLMSLARWQGVVLLVLVAVLWIAVAAGWVENRRMILITAAYGVTAVGVFLWAWWRERGIRRERERCERLLAEFR
ncbi:MAG TPA: hypothetical protein VEA15_11865 [Caulobacteraceae bacterium]|nr:hypothetical protein [Caulobacteraceae bacterium]